MFRAVLRNTVATSHFWLFKINLVKIKIQFLITVQVLNTHTWLVSIILWMVMQLENMSILVGSSTE